MKLVVFRGDAVEAEVRLKGPVLRIGRDGRNDVVLDDPNKGVSRQHCEIRSANGRYQIVDLKSRNGIYIAGRRVKDAADLSLGVPVTVGPFELVLEDDVASADFEDLAALPTSGTVVGGDPEKRRGSSHSGTMPGTRAPSATARSQTRVSPQLMVWAAIAVAALAVGGIAWAVVRNIRQPASTVDSTQADNATVTPPPATAVPPAPVTPPPQDPQVDEQVTAVRNAIGTRDYTSAEAGLEALRDLAPGHPEVEILRAELAQARAAAPPPASPPPVAPPSAQIEDDEPTTPGIPRRANESYSDYLTRSGRAQQEMQSGRAARGREDYAAALRHFRAASRLQAGYDGVEKELEATLARQSAALEAALSSGEKNEQAGSLANARQWYRRAMEIDPTSAPAQAREAGVKRTLFAEAQRLFDSASFAAKSQNPREATRLFKQVVEMLMDGDPLRADAEERLEALAP